MLEIKNDTIKASNINTVRRILATVLFLEKISKASKTIEIIGRAM